MAANAWNSDAKKKEVAEWLIRNPDFDDKPASIEEFLGPGYMDIDRTQNPDLPPRVGIRPGVKQALIDIFGQEVNPEIISEKREALFTGGIGIGKTTMASIALAYMVHWVCCLNDPQSFFGLLKETRIAFMLMSTKDSQAKEVLFGDIKARVRTAEWFKNLETPWKAKSAFDPEYRNQLRFPKDIWVIPGNSAETTFEGYNILGGILDEGDSHKVTENKDYAKEGWRTIKARVTSRFTDPSTGKHRGLLIAIGQMKAAEGFMANMKRAMHDANDKALLEGGTADAKVVEMTIWESFGWESYRNAKSGKIEVFYFDTIRKIIVPEGPAKLVNSETIIPIPISYKNDFELDPVQALKDHAGIPPSVEDPFISAVDRVDEAQDKWVASHEKDYQPVGSRASAPTFDDRLQKDSPHPRAIHVDIAYAAHGDALGMAMGHIPKLVEIDGELKPYIVFDFLLRIKPSGGQTLMLKDFRSIIRDMRDKRKFKIGVVTLDGFQSQDSLQLLQDSRFNAVYLSVDRNKGPYEDLREAIYERRIEFPKYMTYLKNGATETVNIAKKELIELSDTGRKIDHPHKGSKDVADAMAGVVHALMAGPAMRKGAKRVDHVLAPRDPVDLGTLGQGRIIPAADLGQMSPNTPADRILTNPFTGVAIPRDPFARLRDSATLD